MRNVYIERRNDSESGIRGETEEKGKESFS